jgi:hypothetical protein
MKVNRNTQIAIAAVVAVAIYMCLRKKKEEYSCGSCAMKK